MFKIRPEFRNSVESKLQGWCLYLHFFWQDKIQSIYNINFRNQEIFEYACIFHFLLKTPYQPLLIRLCLILHPRRRAEREAHRYRDGAFRNDGRRRGICNRAVVKKKRSAGVERTNVMLCNANAMIKFKWHLIDPESYSTVSWKQASCMAFSLRTSLSHLNLYLLIMKGGGWISQPQAGTFRQ